MINIRRIFVLFFIVFVVICCLLFVMKREMVLGLISGLMIGALNFAAITFTVKSLVKQGSNSAAAAFLTVLIYILKIGIIGCAIAAVVIFGKYFSIKGFLIGFTLTLLIIGVEAVIASVAKHQVRGGRT
jgi:hypothetical protein